MVIPNECVLCVALNKNNILYSFILKNIKLFQANEGELEAALDCALSVGYRHIDTAYVYQNEHVLGRVLRRWLDEGKVKREELFIVTKVKLIFLYAYIWNLGWFQMKASHPCPRSKFHCWSFELASSFHSPCNPKRNWGHFPELRPCRRRNYSRRLLLLRRFLPLGCCCCPCARISG